MNSGLWIGGKMGQVSSPQDTYRTINLQSYPQDLYAVEKQRKFNKKWT